MVDQKTTIWREMTRSGFVKYDISQEVVFPSKVANTPADSIVFIAYKDGLIATGTAFGLEFRWYRRKALAPPYAKV